MNKPVRINIGDYTIDSSEYETLLGVKIDVNFKILTITYLTI